MPRPSHPHRLHYSNYTWRRVQIVKLRYSVSSILRLPPLGPDILLNTLFSNTLSLCSSLNVRDKVSHPHRTIGKIVVLSILIFKLLDNNQEYMQNTRLWNVSERFVLMPVCF
jgi:hypothetical protein